MGKVKPLQFEKREVKLPDGRKEYFYTFPKQEEPAKAKKEERKKK